MMGEESLFPDTPPKMEEVNVLLVNLPPDEKLLSPPPSPGLVDSIKRMGVLHPIIIEPKAGSETQYNVLAGRRRVKAARKAGLEWIPAQVVEMPCGYLLALEENCHRSSNPLAELDAIWILKQSSRLSPEEIAQELSIPVATVRKRLKLDKLSEPLDTAFREGKFSAQAAEMIADLDHEKQRKICRMIDEGEKITAKTVRELRMVQREDAFMGLLDGLPEIEEPRNFSWRDSAKEVLRTLQEFEGMIPDDEPDARGEVQNLIQFLEGI